MHMTLTDEMVTRWGMMVGIPAMMAFLFFIMWNIARESKAGKFGTIMIFIILGAGFMGFAIKEGMVYFMDKRIEQRNQ